MKRGITLMAAVCLLLGGGSSFAEDTGPVVLRDGVFYTVAPAGRVEGSLAIRDGRIEHLGTDAEAMAAAGSEAEVIDLGGRAVTPGLIDAHSHLEGLGDALVEVDLVGTGSYEEVVSRVLAAAETAQADSWILGRGWDQNDWVEKAFPVHGPLSAAVPQHPVWMTRIDGHAALLNARAMTLLGIDGDVVDPPGGRFHRDAAGNPTGVLIDAAMSEVAGLIPSTPPAERRRRILLASDHCLSLGLTTVTDMGIGNATYDAYVSLKSEGELPLRVAAFLTDDIELLSSWFASGPELDPEARLQVRGVKLYADGALGSRGAALLEPYSDDQGNLGLLLTSGDHVEEVCRRAVETGFQVGIHAIGDRGALVALDAFERCFEGPRPEVRFRLEHAQVMRPSDLERMASLGVIASMQPTHATSDMPWAEDRVGHRRIQGAYAWRKVLDAGGELALGSDFPVEVADPRLGLYSAVARQDLEGEPAGGWYPAEALSRAEALAGFTLHAAESLFWETEIGSIEVGKRADLVVWERDIMQVPVTEIPSVGVDMTLVDGAVVYQRGGAE